MNLTIQRKLDEEYTKTLEEVSLARTGSEEAKWALQKLTELHKQMMEETQASDKGYIELQKLHLEERETQLKEQQAKEGRVWNIVKIVNDGVAIVLPVWASWVWMGRGLQFEKTGTFTSRTGNWLGGHLRMFKK